MPKDNKPDGQQELRLDPAWMVGIDNKGWGEAPYSKGNTLFQQGDPADAVFYIRKGTVKVTVVSEQGKEAVVAVMGPDEFVGEGCLTGQARRLATAITLTDCSIAKADKATVFSFIQNNQDFSDFFIQHLLLRTVRVESDLVDQLFNSSEKRLARALLLLANYGKDGSPQPINVKISQEMLAEMIGTTRSRVSHFMNKFRRLGFIDYNGKLEVHSSLLNVLLHDQPRISATETDD